MKRIGIWLFILVLVCTMTLPVLADEITENKNKAQRVNEDIRETRQNLGGVKDEHAGVKKQLESINRDLNIQQDKLVKIEKELDETTKLLVKTRSELDEAIKEVKVYEGLMADRLCAMYMLEGTSYLELLFEARSINEFIDRFEMVKFMITYDNQVFDKMLELQQAIEEKQKDLEEQEAAIKTTQQEIVKQKAAIEEKKKERVQVLGELEAKAAQYEKDLDALEKASNDLEKTIQRLVKEQEEKRKQEAEKQRLEEEKRRAEEEKRKEEQQSQGGNQGQESSRGEGSGSGGEDSSPGGSSGSGDTGGGGQSNTGGAMTWPAPGYRNISSDYGNRWHPVSGQYKFHTGIDISGGGINGKNAVAAKDGVVILSQYYGGYGNTVIIDHGGGITTLYAHGSSTLVSVGQRVSQGQAVLRIGSTGVSTGPHLHFEVRKNGAHTNPWNYLR